MDGLLAHNHFGCFHGSNNQKKSEYLAALKVPGLALVRDLVIDPRNDIEHAYELATADQARRACELAELFLGATDQEAATPAILARGWNVNFRETRSVVPGKECHIIQLDLTKDHAPMLLILGYPDAPEVLVTLPREETLRTCPLKDFAPDQVLKLNATLREWPKPNSFCSRSVEPDFLAILKEQLKL
jgi:hypothetical protein